MSTATKNKRKQEVFALLGGKCKECGEKDERILQIDHRKGDGAEERREIGTSRSKLYTRVKQNPKRYQVLCVRCNWLKRDRDLEMQRERKRESRRVNFRTRSVVGVVLSLLLFLAILYFIERLI